MINLDKLMIGGNRRKLLQTLDDSFNELYETKQNKVWYSDAEPASEESEDGDMWFDIAQNKNSFPLNVLATYSSEDLSASYPEIYAYNALYTTEKIDNCLIPSNSDDIKLYLSADKNDSIFYYPRGTLNNNNLTLNNITTDQNTIFGDYNFLYLYTDEYKNAWINLSKMTYDSESKIFSLSEDLIEDNTKNISSFFINCGLDTGFDFEELSSNTSISMKIVHCTEYTDFPIKLKVSKSRSGNTDSYKLTVLDDQYFNISLEFNSKISTIPPLITSIFEWDIQNFDDVSQITDGATFYTDIDFSGIPNTIGHYFNFQLDNNTILETPIGDPNHYMDYKKDDFIKIYNTVEKLKYYDDYYKEYLININGLNITKKEINDSSYVFSGEASSDGMISFSYDYYPNFILNVEDNFNVKICSTTDYNSTFTEIIKATNSNGIVELYFISFENYKEGTGKYLVLKDQISDTVIIKILLDDINFSSSYDTINNGTNDGSYYKTIHDFCDTTRDIKIQFYIE